MGTTCAPGRKRDARGKVYRAVERVEVRMASGSQSEERRGGDRALIGRLLREAAGYRLLLGLLLTLSLFSVPLLLLTPYPLKLVVDCVLGGRPLPPPLAGRFSEESALELSIGLILGVALVQQLTWLALGVLRTYVSENLTVRFRTRLFAHSQRLSVVFHDSQGSADSIYRIQNDATAIEGLVSDGLIPMCSSALMLLAMGVVTTSISWQLTLIALAIAPVLLILGRYYQQRLRREWAHAKDTESRVLQVVQEVLSTLRVVKAFGQELREEERFAARARVTVRAKVRAAVSQCTFSLLIGMTVAGGVSLVLFAGIRQVQAGALSLGDLTLVMFYLVMLYQPLEVLGVKAAVVQSALASAERAFSLLDRVPEVEQRPAARPLRRAQGRIAFQNVSFEYERERTILSDISFEVPPGARVGLVGATGAGKSTLISLLPRFYDPTGGQVLLDGVDLREYQLPDLRRQYAIVLQDTILFSASIAENIAYGRPGASEAEVIAAARSANAHDFIERLPNGYQTPVGERGTRLSGGERQRIALARAFLRDAPLLILDEPTSAVDIKTEGLVLDALQRLLAGRTTFMISHRPNTLDFCDTILVLDHGRLITQERSGAGFPLPAAQTENSR